MPTLGSDMDEGTLDEWLVKPGDTVTRGQVVAVVETTKAAVEVECWHDGVVAELLVPVGQTVQVGTPLATLVAPDEHVEPTAKSPIATVPTAQPVTPQSSVPTSAPLAEPSRHRRWISPAARRLAVSLDVDLNTLAGTGPQGAVVISDVEHAAAAAKPVEVERPATDRAAEMRKAIAAAMSRSKREIPHYYLTHDISMAEALTWLTERNAQRPITERVLPAVLQLKAVALAAGRVAEFSGHWRNDRFEPRPDVHVGVAISLRGGGLVAPAIHDVANKKLDELMSDLSSLVSRARAGSLRSSELSDATITVTSLGDGGVDAVFGVIYPPQVALVGFGSPIERVRVVDGGIRVVPTTVATLSADHRASDGRRGSLFLTLISDLLQHPDALEA